MAYYMLPRLQAARRRATSALVRVLKRGNRALCDCALRASARSSWRLTAVAVLSAARRRIAASARVPAALQRRHLHHQRACFNPGSRSPRSSRVGLIAEQLIMEVPEVRTVGPPHRPRRARRARRGRPFIGHRGRPQAVARGKARDRAADIRARLAVLPVSRQCRTADLPPARPHALRRARRDRTQDLRRRPRYAARTRGGACGSGSPPIPALVDLQVEKQVRIPQLRDPRRLRPRRALRRAARGRGRAAEPRSRTAASCRSVVDGYRRFDVTMRLLKSPAHDRTAAGRSADRDAGAAGSRRGRSPTSRDRRPKPDPARERPPPHRRARQHRRHRRHGAASSRRSGSELGATQLPEGYFTRLEGTFQAQEEASRAIDRLLSLLSLALIFAVLYQPLPARRCSPSSSWAACRSRSSAASLRSWLAGQPLSVASMIGFITLDRHRHAQRHPQDQPLHQPGAARGRCRSAASWSSAAALERLTPGADDGAGGRRRAAAAADRRGDARQGRSCIRWR